MVSLDYPEKRVLKVSPEMFVEFQVCQERKVIAD
jgi:hypothetical protein